MSSVTDCTCEPAHVRSRVVPSPSLPLSSRKTHDSSSPSGSLAGYTHPQVSTSAPAQRSRTSGTAARSQIERFVPAHHDVEDDLVHLQVGDQAGGHLALAIAWNRYARGLGVEAVDPRLGC